MKIQFEGLEIDLTKNGGQYGIETLKIVAGDVYHLWEKIVKRSKGGFNFIEIFQTGVSISGVVSDVMEVLTDLRKEINDLSEEEMQSLVLYFMQRFDLGGGAAKDIINFVVIEGIGLIFTGVRIYEFVKERLDKK